METFDWFWTLTGLIWLLGAYVCFQNMFRFGEFGKVLSFMGVLLFAIVGILLFLDGVGIVSGDSEPWEHVEWMFIAGDLLAAYLAWRFFRRRQ